MTHPLAEYNDLLKLLEDDEKMRKDVYQDLVNKEKDVLDIISRVAEQKERASPFLTPFSRITVAEAIARFSFTWKNIVTELIESRGHNFFIIMLKDDRKIYVGIMIIMLALLIFFVGVSE